MSKQPTAQSPVNVPSFGVTDSDLIEKSPDCCSSDTLLLDKVDAEVDAIIVGVGIGRIWYRFTYLVSLVPGS
jgi:hypothetical protein